MSRNLVSLILLLFSISLPASACRMLPIEKNVERYIYDLVKGTPDIYLAEAESFSKDDESVTLKVKEVIRGEKKDSITIPGNITSPGTNDYNLHRKNIFWENILEGRTTYGVDCRFNPTFEIGGKYLILFKEPFQSKSLELIKSKNDFWYYRVKEILGMKKFRKFIPKRDAP